MIQKRFYSSLYFAVVLKFYDFITKSCCQVTENQCTVVSCFFFLILTLVCIYFSVLSVKALSFLPLVIQGSPPLVRAGQGSESGVWGGTGGSEGDCERGQWGSSFLLKAWVRHLTFWKEKKTAHSCDQLRVEQQVQEFVLTASARNALIWRDSWSVCQSAIAME